MEPKIKWRPFHCRHKAEPSIPSSRHRKATCTAWSDLWSAFPPKDTQDYRGANQEAFCLTSVHRFSELRKAVKDQLEVTVCT